MVIIHKYKCLFIELPRTATTAISNKLMESYDGNDILYDHDTYKNFLKIATDEEKKYFTFSCIRNPIDRTYSYYVKYKNSSYDYLLEKERRKGSLISYFFRKRRLKWFKKHNPDFFSFLKKYYKLPYCDWSCLNSKDFNFIIRFENLEEDFFKALNLIGIKPKRLLPQLNVTKGKKSDYMKDFSPEQVKDVKKNFGPFMEGGVIVSHPIGVIMIIL